MMKFLIFMAIVVAGIGISHWVDPVATDGWVFTIGMVTGWISQWYEDSTKK